MYFETISWYIAVYGLVAVFLFMFSNGIFSIPPSEVVLAVGGALAAAHYWSVLSIIIVAITGNLAGACTLYFLGSRIGYSWVQVARRWSLSVHIPRLVVDVVFPEARVVDELHYALRNRSAAWVGICRCLPIVRSIISLPAGMAHMPLSRFMGWSFSGIAVWALLWIAIGYFLQSNWHRVGGRLSSILIAVLCVAVILTAKHIFKSYYTR